MNGRSTNTRRTFLRALGGTAALSLAGCVSNGDHTDATPTATESPAEIDGWEESIEFEDVDRAVYVEARSYEFTPGSDEPIRVLVGETVGLAFTSLDTGYHAGHGFEVAAYDIDLQANLREVETTTFLADQSGEFDVRCSVYCSDGHASMTGTLLVEADD